MRVVGMFLVAVIMGIALGGAIGQVDKHTRATEAKAQDKVIQERAAPQLAETLNHN